MKKSLSIAIALASMTTASLAVAEIDLYGKANVSLEMVNEGDVSTTELLSNASRLGFKGSEKINDQLEAIYQLEYEVYFDDSETFKQRNIFIGLKGGFGQVIAGNFDTPLKVAQNKIDLFNDLRGDIKNVITVNDNRTSNTVQYSTPETGGFGANLAVISSEVEGQDAGKSLSVSWANEMFYVAGAFEQDVEDENAEAMRAVAQINLNAVQLGALYEQYEEENQDSVDGWLVSAQFKVASDWALKAQYGQSDQHEEGGETMSIGADYKLSKNAKVFGFYTEETADNDVLDNDYAGIGMELKF